VPLLRLRSVQVFYNRDDELKKLLALADGLPQGKVEDLALRGGVARLGAGRHQFADENLWPVPHPFVRRQESAGRYVLIRSVAYYELSARVDRAKIRIAAQVHLSPLGLTNVCSPDKILL